MELELVIVWAQVVRLWIWATVPRRLNVQRARGRDPNTKLH